MSEFEIAQPPTDGVSAVCFGKAAYGGSQFLQASSWDGSVVLYDVANNAPRTRYQHDGPVLCCTMAPDTFRGFSGGLDAVLKVFDYGAVAETVLGEHSDAIKCVGFAEEHGLVLSGGWDGVVHAWDERQAGSDKACVMTLDQDSKKVYTMALSGNRVVVGTADRLVNIFDLRRPEEPEQRRESSLRHQTRTIACYPDGTGYALSSIEGRVAMEYFDPSEEAQDKKFAFKCHRISTDQVETVFPVNAIAFHPVWGTFATGGGDGIINVWDGAHKKRLCQFHEYPTSVAALDFSPDGSLLAIASSYTYEQGERDHPPDAIYIHQVADEEVKPKV